MADKITRINPATLELVSEVETYSPDQIPQIIENARKSQQEWSNLSIRNRKKLLKSVISYLINHVEELAKVIAQETGKPRIEAITCDLTASIPMAAYCADMISRIFKPQSISFGNLSLMLKYMGRSSYLMFRPLGVIGIISPWNFPFGIPFSEVIMAVTAGNAVILKPSSETPNTGLKIQEIFDNTGFPAHLVQTIPGSGSTLGKALVEGGVDRIVFTGSAEVGQKIMELASHKFIPLTLELSGKDPMIIRADTDLNRTVSGAVWGSFVNAGQMCVGVRRIIVHRSIYDQFLEKFRALTQTLKQGWGWEDPDISVGPLINENAVHEMEAHVQNAIDQGARVVIGGKRNPDLQGYFFEPTIIADVTETMDIFTHETFGPITTVTPYDSDEEAIRIANNCDFALAGSVWTKDLKRGKWMAEQMESGTVIINNAAYTYGLPMTIWGGRKKSGFGRTHGELGFHELMDSHHVHIDKGKFSHEIWWNPYSADKLQANLDFLDVAFSTKKRQYLSKVNRILRNLQK